MLNLPRPAFYHVAKYGQKYCHDWTFCLHRNQMAWTEPVWYGRPLLNADGYSAQNKLPRLTGFKEAVSHIYDPFWSKTLDWEGKHWLRKGVENIVTMFLLKAIQVESNFALFNGQCHRIVVDFLSSFEFPLLSFLSFILLYCTSKLWTRRTHCCFLRAMFI